MSDIESRLTTALADHYRVERELGQDGMATMYLVAVLGAERFVPELKTKVTQ